MDVWDVWKNQGRHSPLLHRHPVGTPKAYAQTGSRKAFSLAEHIVDPRCFYPPAADRGDDGCVGE